MLPHEIYFIKNGVAIVAVNRDPTRRLPKPWPCLLNGMYPHVEEFWVDFFAEFLAFNGEDPGNFELHWPDGYIQRIDWDPKSSRWGKKFVRQTMPLLDLWRLITERA